MFLAVPKKTHHGDTEGTEALSTIQRVRPNTVLCFV